jgi:hypothetical protein
MVHCSHPTPLVSKEEEEVVVVEEEEEEEEEEEKDLVSALGTSVGDCRSTTQQQKATQTC